MKAFPIQILPYLPHPLRLPDTIYQMWITLLPTKVEVRGEKKDQTTVKHLKLWVQTETKCYSFLMGNSQARYEEAIWFYQRQGWMDHPLMFTLTFLSHASPETRDMLLSCFFQYFHSFPVWHGSISVIIQETPNWQALEETLIAIRSGNRTHWIWLFAFLETIEPHILTLNLSKTSYLSYIEHKQRYCDALAHFHYWRNEKLGYFHYSHQALWFRPLGKWSQNERISLEEYASLPSWDELNIPECS